MKIILQENNKYLLRFDLEEEIIKALENFCQSKNIKAGVFFGIGATQEIQLSWYNLEKKEYKDKTIKEMLEISALSGNIAKMQGKIIIHAHGIFSNSKMQVQAGHIKKLIVAATCEIFLEVFDAEVEREYSKEIGLNLMS